MTAPAETIRISSRDNALFKELRQLAADGAGYRKAGRIWVEGEHLCLAALERGQRAELAVFSESFVPDAIVSRYWIAIKKIVLSDRLFGALSQLESPAGCALVVRLSEPPPIASQAASVVLDRLQDAGNVGSILRSAAAFGFSQVLALKGTAALWSAKVLRAGMGAHFGLRLIEQLEPADLDALAVPVRMTSSHEGEWLHEARLPHPCAWVFGHEGQGIGAQLGERLAARAGGLARSIRIAQPGGEESLNVAAAAAICLHASAAVQATNAPVRA